MTVTTTRSGGKSPRTILLYVGIVVGVAAVLFAAFGMGEEAGPSVEEVAGDPEVVGEALPPGEDPANDPALGGPVPVVTGTDFDGNEVIVGDAEAEMILFLASWCPACQAEVPEVVEWLEAGGLPDGVELNAVATGLDDGRPNWPPQDWLEREDFDRPVIVDDAEGTIAAAYGMTATPFWVFVADGELQGRVAGQMSMDQIAQVAEQLAGS
jgi:cytochrome c biogenesis protein CcmG, thiol:disulfide interchange protein DsbE